MTEREHVYQPMRKALYFVDWNRLENLVGSGMPDINGCSPRGVAAWIETKIIHGNQITFQRFQPAWLKKRLSYRDRVYVLARKNDMFYLWGGQDLDHLLSCVDSRQEGKIHVVDYRVKAATVELSSPAIWERLHEEVFMRGITN